MSGYCLTLLVGALAVIALDVPCQDGAVNGDTCGTDVDEGIIDSSKLSLLQKEMKLAESSPHHHVPYIAAEDIPVEVHVTGGDVTVASDHPAQFVPKATALASEGDTAAQSGSQVAGSEGSGESGSKGGRDNGKDHGEGSGEGRGEGAGEGRSEGAGEDHSEGGGSKGSKSKETEAGAGTEARNVPLAGDEPVIVVSHARVIPAGDEPVIVLPHLGDEPAGGEPARNVPLEERKPVSAVSTDREHSATVPNIDDKIVWLEPLPCPDKTAAPSQALSAKSVAPPSQPLSTKSAAPHQVSLGLGWIISMLAAGTCFL